MCRVEAEPAVVEGVRHDPVAGRRVAGHRHRHLHPGLARECRAGVRQGYAGGGEGGDVRGAVCGRVVEPQRSDEHTSELQSLMRISYAVFCLKNKTTLNTSA